MLPSHPMTLFSCGSRGRCRKTITSRGFGGGLKGSWCLVLQFELCRRYVAEGRTTLPEQRFHSGDGTDGGADGRKKRPAFRLSAITTALEPFRKELESRESLV